MSIIYEALKKAEKTIGIATEIKKNTGLMPSRPKTNPYLIFLLIACLTLYIANSIFNFIVNANKPAAPAVLIAALPQEALPAPAPEPEIKKEEPPPAPPLILNGIFYSQDGGYALINNRIVRVGDIIEGAIVKRINLDEVELEGAGKTIKLTRSP